MIAAARSLLRRQLIAHMTCGACGHQMIWSTWAGRFLCGYCD